MRPWRWEVVRGVGKTLGWIVIPLLMTNLAGFLHRKSISGETETDEIRNTVQKHLEHCEICSAILDSTRNILILTADERVFELPLGFSQRLHARLEAEIR